MLRRRFLQSWALALPALAAEASERVQDRNTAARPVTLFLGGDVMTGRGIDQILPRPGDPALHEAYVKSARGYVDLAQRTNGRLPDAVDDAYPWGDALAELDRQAPDVRIVNLETAVTARGDPWPGKGIHYRMHPGNLPCLVAARIDCFVLANNHVLDWGPVGLADTLASLHRAGIQPVGAGKDAATAAVPAVLGNAGSTRVLVFAWGMASSGVAETWAADDSRPGVNFLPDLSSARVETIASKVLGMKKPGDIAVASIHWGSNWGFDIPGEHRQFARALIDRAKIDVVHGHSSHHPRGIEVYRGKPILYGCGDLINDYEGIGGHEMFRSDLGLLYFVRFDQAGGQMQALTMIPMRRRRLRLERTPNADAAWLHRTMDRECRSLGCRVQRQDDALVLAWTASGEA